MYTDSSDSSSSDEASSDEEDTALLVLQAVVFPPKEIEYKTGVCIENLGEYECERLFR